MKRVTQVAFVTSDNQSFGTKDEAFNHEVNVVLGSIVGQEVVDRLRADAETLETVLSAVQTLRRMTRPKKERKPKAEKAPKAPKESKDKKSAKAS